MISGHLIRRYKRFLADVRLEGGKIEVAHCPNPGAMTGCMADNCRIWLRKSTNTRRKLKWTWELTELDRAIILINTHRANKVMYEVLRNHLPSDFDGYSNLQAEVKIEDGSRIDFCLSQQEKRFWIEVKSATYLLKEGVAGFPDSKTKRGTKHLQSLIRKVNSGDRACLVYLIGRTDAKTVVPASEIDPVYAEQVKLAKDAGVQFFCLTTDINPQGILPIHWKRL